MKQRGRIKLGKVHEKSLSLRKLCGRVRVLTVEEGRDICLLLSQRRVLRGYIRM